MNNRWTGELTQGFAGLSLPSELAKSVGLFDIIILAKVPRVAHFPLVPNGHVNFIFSNELLVGSPFQFLNPLMDDFRRFRSFLLVILLG